MNDPILLVLFYALVFAALPALIAALLMGGRGVLWLIAIAFVGVAGYLIWGFGFGGIPLSTGMEGLAIVILLGLWAAAVLWAGLIYAIVGACRLLPDQRQARRARRSAS